MILRPALLIALALLACRPALADRFDPAQRQEIIATMREALKADPSILREALVALQADDARQQDKVTSDVLALLAGKLVDPADPVAGNPLADTTIVQFYDTRCPYCRRMLPTLAELLRNDPNVRIVYKDLPILGPASQLESRALLAAQRQGGYFKLHDLIMQTAAPATRDSLRADADRLGLDGGRLMRDMDDPAIKARLEANIGLAQQLGVQGTPALIVGKRLIGGAVELGDLRQAVADARSAK